MPNKQTGFPDLPTDGDEPDDISDLDTIEMAIIEIQAAVRHEYEVLRALHAAAASRARSQADLIGEAAARTTDPPAAANLRAFELNLRQRAAQNEAALKALRHETGG